MATSIENEVNRIKQNIEEAYNALENKGATMPTERTSAYLLDTIESLSVGGSGTSIIYATELPSTPTQAIYVVTQDEVVKAEVVMYGEIAPAEMGYCEIVDVLPETGTLLIDMVTQAIYLYYLTTDGHVYGYINDIMASEMGLPEGWNDMTTVMGVIVITSLDDFAGEINCLATTQPKTRVYVPMQDGTFLELTSGIRTRFDEKLGTVSITEM